MLERVWRKGNPLTLLVGMRTSTATMENSVENPMDRGAWQATVHGVARVGHDLATKPQLDILAIMLGDCLRFSIQTNFLS